MTKLPNIIFITAILFSIFDANVHSKFVISILFFSAIHILISCGETKGGSISKSGVISLSQNAQGSFQTTYKPSKDYFRPICGGFGVNCNGKIICGAGQTFTNYYTKNLNNVFECLSGNFTEIQPLTTGRILCSSLYIPPALEYHHGLLLVAGSRGIYVGGIDGAGGNKMEYLMVNNEVKTNNWRECDDSLPGRASLHQMNLLQNKLILTGGVIDGFASNKVWQGIISFNQNLRVNWSPLPPMREDRVGHAAIVIQDKLFCIGGQGSQSSEYFSSESNCWRKGPEISFKLSGAKAVLTKKQNQCFLLGGWRDGNYSENIILFDPIKGVTNIEGSLDIGHSIDLAVVI